MPSIYSRKDRATLRQIRSRIAVAQAGLERAIEAGNVRSIAECRREIAAAERDRDLIKEQTAARREAQKEKSADELLAQIREQFPVIGVSSRTDWGKLLSGESQPTISHEPQHAVTVEELTQEIQATRDRLQSLGSDTKYFAVRKYLEDRVNSIGALLRADSDDCDR